MISRFAFKFCHVLREIHYFHPVIDAGIGRDITGPAPDLFRIPHHVQPEDSGAPGSRKNEVEQNADGSRFPGAIGTNESEKISTRNREVQAIDSTRAAIGFSKITDFQEIHRKRPCSNPARKLSEMSDTRVKTKQFIFNIT